MIWYSGVCKCYLEYERNPNGSLASLILTRACAFHIALEGKPELFTTLQAEGGLMSHTVEAVKLLDGAADVFYTYDADRKLSIQTTSVLGKIAIQTAVTAAVGAGKVTVV